MAFPIFAAASLGMKIGSSIFGAQSKRAEARKAKKIADFNATILDKKALQTEDLARFEVAQNAAQEVADLDFIDFQDDLLDVESVGQRLDTSTRANMIRKQGTRLVSSQKVAAASQGRAIGGSALEVMIDSAAFFEMEALEETRQGKILQQGLEREKDLLGRERVAVTERGRVTRGLLKRVGRINAQNFRDSAAVTRMGGQVSAAALKTEAATGLLSGATSTASQAFQLKQAGAFK